LSSSMTIGASAYCACKKVARALSVSPCCVKYPTVCCPARFSLNGVNAAPGGLLRAPFFLYVGSWMHKRTRLRRMKKRERAVMRMSGRMNFFIDKYEKRVGIFLYAPLYPWVMGTARDKKSSMSLAKIVAQYIE